MQARKITLIEIGAGGLPVVTPVQPMNSSWFPVVYTPPGTPSVEGVVPSPVADGVLIEWAAVDQEGVIYIIERGPTPDGPWTEIHRTTETRYLYSDGSGQEWWFKITASVRGKAGEGSIVGAQPGKVPNYAEMEALNQALGQEILDRLAGDLKAANDAIAAARTYTDDQVAALNGILTDIVGADEWTAEVSYPVGDFVRRAGTLYRAVQQNTAVEPGSNAAVWQEIGDYTSVGDALAASISMATQNTSDILAESTRLDAVVARMPAGTGGVASAASVSALSQASSDGLSAMGQRVGLVEAKVPSDGQRAASTAQVATVDQARSSGDAALGQRIDSTNAALEGKASATALQLLGSQVSDVDNRLVAVSQAVTQVQVTATPNPNILPNSTFRDGLAYWSAPQNAFGALDVAFGPFLAMTATAGGEGAYQWITNPTPGTYYLSGEVYRNGSAGNARLSMTIYDGASQAIDSVTSLSDPAVLAKWQKVVCKINVPYGTNRILVGVITEGTNAIMSFRRLKLELGQGATAWSDEASVTQTASATQALAVRATQLENGQTQLQAQYSWQLDVNGRAIGMTSLNNGTIGRIDFVADRFGIVDPNNTGSTTFEAGRWVTRSGGYMQVHGKPFGTTGDLMFYIGVGSDPNAASKGNGIFWIDNKGNAYFGGSLSAGVLRNGVQTGTTQTIGTELVNGPFRTNGNNRIVTLSFVRTHRRQRSAGGSTGWVAGAGSNTAQVQLFRQIGTGGWVLWQVLNVTGSVNISNETDGPDIVDSGWSGSFTVNDSSSPLETVSYRALVTAFTEQSVAHQSGSFDVQTITQNLSIISVEQ